MGISFHPVCQGPVWGNKKQKNKEKTVENMYSGEGSNQQLMLNVRHKVQHSSTVQKNNTQKRVMITKPGVGKVQKENSNHHRFLSCVADLIRLLPLKDPAGI